jgi:tetratricopeptide (TPR) repeat protein
MSGGARAMTRDPVDVKVSIGRLPATSAELFGREADLAWLDACWQEGVHVASVVAFGGVGKSALVNRWLARMRDAGWNGAERVHAWSFFSQGTDRLGASDEFFADALKELGDTEEPPKSPWDKGERLAKLVRKERAILILDGIEPLQWGPGVQTGKLKDQALEALVKGLGAQNKGLCLITSRIAVADLEALRGDKVRAKVLSNLSPEAGAQLLASLGVKGSEDELQEASREYKGHGLALALLGSYLSAVAEGDIRQRREIGPLERAEQLGGDAQRVMAAYERWLSKPEVAILHLIGLFDRPVQEDEIAALRAEPIVAGLNDALVGLGAKDWNKAVTKLRATGLLLAAQADKSLDAHPLVREHFGAQLAREQPEAWREGHRRLYEHLKQKAKDLPETIEEMAPLYAAVVHGCLAGRNQEALASVYVARISRGESFFNMSTLGAVSSEVAVFAAFFDPPWERLAPGLGEAEQAFVLTEAGFALRASGRLSEAEGLMRSALTQCTAREDWKRAAAILAHLGEIVKSRGELKAALEFSRRGVEIADRSGDALRRAGNRVELAAVLRELGQQTEAAAAFEEAEQIQGTLGPDFARLAAYRGFQYCVLLLDQGELAEVQRRTVEALKSIPPYYSVLDTALDHLSFGLAHLLAFQRGAGGDLAEATRHLDLAIEGLRRSGVQDMLPAGLLARAALRIHTCEFADAACDLDEALSLAVRCGLRLHEADARLGFARFFLAEVNPRAAREHLGEARRIVSATGYHRRDGELAELEAACAEEEEKETQRRQDAKAQKGKEEAAPLPSFRASAPLRLCVPSSPDRGAEPPPPPSIAPTTPDEFLEALRALLPAQFERVLFALRAPIADLVPATVPQSMRAIEFLRWAEQAGRLSDVARVLGEIRNDGGRG